MPYITLLLFGCTAFCFDFLHTTAVSGVVSAIYVRAHLLAAQQQSFFDLRPAQMECKMYAPSRTSVQVPWVKPEAKFVRLKARLLLAHQHRHLSMTVVQTLSLPPCIVLAGWACTCAHAMDQDAWITRSPNVYGIGVCDAPQAALGTERLLSHLAHTPYSVLSMHSYSSKAKHNIRELTRGCLVSCPWEPAPFAWCLCPFNAPPTPAVDPKRRLGVGV